MVFDRYANLMFNAGFERKPPPVKANPFMSTDIKESKGTSKRRAKNKIARKSRRLNKKKRRK